MICFVTPYVGKIVIHCGKCRTKKIDFSYLPDFLIPYHWLSKLTLKELVKRWLVISDANEVLVQIESKHEETDCFFSLSTFYYYLAFVVKILILNSVFLDVKVESTIIAILQSLKDPNIFKKLFNNKTVVWTHRVTRDKKPP